jgi:hypothetical protein
LHQELNALVKRRINLDVLGKCSSLMIVLPDSELVDLPGGGSEKGKLLFIL